MYWIISILEALNDDRLLKGTIQEEKIICSYAIYSSVEMLIPEKRAILLL